MTRPTPVTLDAITRALALLQPAPENADLVKATLGIVAPEQEAARRAILRNVERDPQDARADLAAVDAGEAPSTAGATPAPAGAAPRVTRMFQVSAEPERQQLPDWLGSAAPRLRSEEGRKPSVFLSFAGEDAEWKRSLMNPRWWASLTRVASIDDYDDAPTRSGSFGAEIDARINSSSAFIAIISKDYIQKEGVIEREFRAAVERYSAPSSQDLLFIIIIDDDAKEWWRSGTGEIFRQHSWLRSKIYWDLTDRGQPAPLNGDLQPRYARDVREFAGRLAQALAARPTETSEATPRVAPLALYPGPPGPARSPENLIHARTARGILKALLASDAEDGSVDVDELIATLVRGRPLTRWPRRLVTSLAHGASIVVDTGAQLTPFRPDVAGLLATLRNVIGSDRLAVHRCNAWPPRVVAADAAVGAMAEGAFVPPSRVPVLVISDFGLSPGPEEMIRATPADWCAFAAALRRLGRKPIGLVPFPEDEWPSDLARSFALVHWSTTTNARAARRAREPGMRFASPPGASRNDVERRVLARALAPAARIDRALLRAMRLAVLPQSSPAVEARFWWSDDIGSHGEAAITLDPARAGALRAELSTMPAAEIARRLEIIKRMHEGESPALLLEEEIVALDITRPHGWQSTIATRLRALLRALIEGDGGDGKRMRDAARWCFAALPELELPEQAVAAARDLMFAAGQRLGALPLSSGPLAHADGPPEWLMTALRPDPTRPRLSIAITWNRQGLRVASQDVFAGEHAIVMADAPYPALRVTWPGTAEKPRWIAVRHGATLRPPPVSAALLTAQDGASWLIEDADVADARPPLRVYVLDHPDRRAESAAFVQYLEDALRSHAGLPENAAVIARGFLAESWRGPQEAATPARGMTGTISTWRAANRALIDAASVHVVVATKEMLGAGDWSLDPLKAIEEISAAGRSASVYPVDWDQAWWLPAGTTAQRDEPITPAPQWPREAGWLRDISWLRDGRNQARTVADAIARRIVESRRDGSGANAAARLQARLRSASIDAVVAALQGLALAFHVRRFEPGLEMDPAKLDRKIWGLDALPQTGQTISPPPSESYRDVAEADFAFLRYMSEYIYAGPVKNYLAGRDPFGPEPNAADYKEEIGLLLAGKTPRRYPSYLGAGLAAMTSFAGRPEKAALAELVGDVDQFGRELDEGPRGANWARVADLLANQGDAIIAAVRPFDTQFNSWRVRRPFLSLSNCRTFPEFMEAYSGLFIHCLRAAAQGAPDRRVILTYPSWFEHQKTVQDLFPHCFDFLNDAPRDGATPDRQQMSVPIKHYADLVASLSDLIALALSARVGEAKSDTLREEENFVDLATERPQATPKSSITEEWLKYAPRPNALSGTDRWNVFLSYRSINRAWMINLYDVLRRLNHRVFVDEMVLEPGDQLIKELQDALKTSQAGILIWSSASGDSDWVQREYQTLERWAKEREGFQFVTVRLDRSELPLFAKSRIFLDFADYPDGPDGGELLKLLHAIAGIPLSEEAARFALAQDAAAQSTANKIKAAIDTGNAMRLVTLFEEDGLSWRLSAALGCKAAEGLARLGHHDEAIAMLKKLEAQFARAIRPKQLRARVQARLAAKTKNLGLLDEAQEILSELYAAGHRDPETLGIYARTWMDRYSFDQDEPSLRKSRDLYAEAFDRAPDDDYTGINAAAKSVFLGAPADLEKAQAYAARVLEIVGTEAAAHDYWKTITMADAFLIQGNYGQAAALYQAAVAMAPNETASHQTGWAQASLLMAKLGATAEEQALVRQAFGTAG